MNRKQASLLAQLNTLQQNIPKQFHQKQTTRQTIASSLVGIDILQKNIRKNLEACQRILRCPSSSAPSSTTRAQRKQRIIDLNNAVMAQYQPANQQLQHNIRLIENGQKLNQNGAGENEYAVDFKTDSKQAKCLLLDIERLALSMHAAAAVDDDDDDDMKLSNTMASNTSKAPLNGMQFQLQSPTVPAPATAAATCSKGVLRCTPMPPTIPAMPAISRMGAFDAQRMAECLVPNQHIIENLDYAWKYVRVEGMQCSSGEVYFEARVLCSVLGTSNLTTIQIGWCLPPDDDTALCDDFEYVVIGNRFCSDRIAGLVIHKQPFEISANSELEIGFGVAHDCVCCLANFTRQEFTFWINGRRCKVMPFPDSCHHKTLTPVIGLSKASVQLNFKKLQYPIPQLILSPNTCAVYEYEYMAEKHKQVQKMALSDCNTLLDQYRVQKNCGKAQFWLNRVGQVFVCTFVLDGKRIVHHSADADSTAVLLKCVREFVETYVENMKSEPAAVAAVDDTSISTTDGTSDGVSDGGCGALKHRGDTSEQDEWSVAWKTLQKYAKRKNLDCPQLEYSSVRSQKSDDSVPLVVCSCTLKLDGKTITHQHENKSTARLLCVNEFIDSYVHVARVTL